MSLIYAIIMSLCSLYYSFIHEFKCSISLLKINSNEVNYIIFLADNIAKLICLVLCENSIIILTFMRYELNNIFMIIYMFKFVYLISLNCYFSCIYL